MLKAVEQPLTEGEVSQMREKVHALAQQHYTDKEELEAWLGKLDSELQESDLQERGNDLQWALKKLEAEVKYRRAPYKVTDGVRSNDGPAEEQVEVLKLLCGASELLRMRWPEDALRRRKAGRIFSKEGQISELNLEGCTDLRWLPVEVGKLLALTSLGLERTALTTLPAEVGGLRALTSLDLSYCKALTTLPAEVGGLRALTSLDLSYCKALTTLPAAVCGLRALTSLDLSNSALTTLPAAVGGLRALTSLKLGGTGLTTLPVEVGGLRALTSLNLGGITAPMTLPAEVGGLRALTSLDLSYTDLATLPVEVGGLRALISLNLRECTALKLLPEKIHEEDLIAIRAHLVSAFVKDWANNPKVAQRLHDYPNMLHALAEEPAAANFLRAVFEADPTLADITKGDLNGNTPIDHACPQCRRAMRTALCLLGRFEIDDGPPLHFSATSAVVQANHFVDAEGSSGADAKPLRRALKAMRETTQVLAELNGREGPDSKH
eukprot:scaffold45165_cov66-Phaeocystis_antarctica.AAC.3